MKNVHLLIIDPQNDFCDSNGALYVPGADSDMSRLATMIERVSNKLEDIHITMDSHHFVDVAHPVMWRDSAGNHPNPFTIITSQDIENGVWVPTKPGLTRRMLDYVKTLEAGSRYPLCIWPPHCLIGSWGHSVYPAVFEAVKKWEEDNFAIADYVTKGSNVYTEHYSGVKAEVPDPEDPSTQINTVLVETLMEADVIAVAGEAGSHCLANTMRDIAEAFGDDSLLSRIVLLLDATSPVPGFENLQEDFVKDMTARGMQVSTTVDFLS